MSKSAGSRAAGSLKPIYALVGADSYLQVEELRRVAAMLPPGAQRVEFDGEIAQLAEVLDEARSFAMFGGGGKLVVVRNADEFVTRFREQLEDYAAQPSDSATLVLRMNSLPANQRIHKLISKSGEVIKCEPPAAAQLPNWVIGRAREAHHIELSLDAARALVDLIGSNLGRLDNELAKLALQTEPGGRVALDAIAGNVAFQREQEMWELTNALARGDGTAAMKRWRELLESDPASEFRAVTWLTMWLDDVHHVLSARRANQRPDFRKLWRYKGDQLNRFLTTCQALGDEGFARAVDLLAEVDRNSKSGVGQFSTNVERFILSLGR